MIAISTALPQDNRKDIAKYGDFPFPLLSDPDFHVHRDWGRIDVKTARPLSGLILVDRKGWITSSGESGRTPSRKRLEICRGKSDRGR